MSDEKFWAIQKFERGDISRQDLDKLINHDTGHGYQPLHDAAVWGQIGHAKSLLDYGVDVNTKTKDGYTALGLAAKNGHRALEAVLRERGGT